MHDTDVLELQELRKFKATVEPVIREIYDILYWDGSERCYDPDYEWSQDEIELVAAQLLKLYGRPKRGATKYPDLKLRG